MRDKTEAVLVFPRFLIVKDASAGAGRVAGLLSSASFRSERWVNDESWGYLRCANELISGRWHKLGERWEFAPDLPQDGPRMLARPEWEVLDGYWGERAELVFDSNRRWERKRFQPSDEVFFGTPGDGGWSRKLTVAVPEGGTIIKDGWDHEHCAICWQKIGRNGQPEGYFSEPDEWACERCYLEFVEPQSLAFISTHSG